METDGDICCNVIHCRKPLSQETRACVTSCSHIFCMDCANHHFSKALVCPACETSLTQSDDIVLSELNPTEQYKSSVLAGMRPDIIMDIASRAIAFYHYQTTQEICYRSMVHQTLEARCNTFQERLRNVSTEAHRALQVEREHTQVARREQEHEKRRAHDLQMQLQEKVRQFQKLQALYEKLKRKMLTSNMQQSIIQHQDNASMSTTGGNIQQPMPMVPRPSIPFSSNNFEPAADAYHNAPTATNTPAHSMIYQRQQQQQQGRPPPPPPPPPLGSFERPPAPLTLEPTFQPRVPHRPNSTLPRPFISNTPNAPMSTERFAHYRQPFDNQTVAGGQFQHHPQQQHHYHNLQRGGMKMVKAARPLNESSGKIYATVISPPPARPPTIAASVAAISVAGTTRRASRHPQHSGPNSPFRPPPPRQ